MQANVGTHKYRQKGKGDATQMKKHEGKVARQELYSMLTDERNQELVLYAEQEKRELLSDWIGGNSETVRTNLRFKSALLIYVEHFLQESDESRYAALKLGSLLGVVESLEKIQFEQNQDMWAHARFSKEPVKHLPEIVRALETHGSMSHAELSKYLSMNPSTLSEAMKKVLNTGAVQSSTIGKYKIYSLSDAGMRYGKELRNAKNLDQSLVEINERITELLNGAKNEKERELVESSIIKSLRIDPGTRFHIGDIMQLYDSDYPFEIPEKFQIDAMINIIGSDDKFLKGHWENDLGKVTNEKKHSYPDRKRQISKHSEKRFA